VRKRWPFRALDFGTADAPSGRWPLDDTLAILARTCPDLEEIAISAHLIVSHVDAMLAIVPQLSDHFPKLARIKLPLAAVENGYGMRPHRAAIVALRGVPLVEATT
jgi:hypothetical protein